jgi:3-oxoacyl-(acyl-carrier-protein) synthase
LHHLNDRRVVITGMGIISSCGKSLSDFWDCVSSGKSGIKRLHHLKNFNLPSTVGG